MYNIKTKKSFRLQSLLDLATTSRQNDDRKYEVPGIIHKHLYDVVQLFAEGWWAFTSMTAMTRCASTLVSLCMATKRYPAEERKVRPASTTGLPPGAPELDARRHQFVFLEQAQARALIGQGKQFMGKIPVTANMLVDKNGTPYT